MELITQDGALGWCEAHGLGFRSDFQTATPLRLAGQAQAIRVSIEGSPTDVIGMAYVLLMTGVPDDNEEFFEGALIWLRDWDIWSRGAEQVGHLLAYGIRGSGTPSIAHSPGHIFGSGEFVAARAVLTLPMLFQWDAIFAPANGRFLAILSHHGYVDLSSFTFH